jgi:hypothetical protein
MIEIIIISSIGVCCIIFYWYRKRCSEINNPLLSESLL